MEAHSMPSQYGLAANGGHAKIRDNPAVNNGDFAAGCRELESRPGARGDFATGTRSTPLLMTVGDFASGLHTRPAADVVVGDFASGQRTGRSHAAIRHGQPARRGVAQLWPNSLRST